MADFDFHALLDTGAAKYPTDFSEFVTDFQLPAVAGDKIIGKLDADEIKAYLEYVGADHAFASFVASLEQDGNQAIAKATLKNQGRELDREQVANVLTGIADASDIETYWYLEALCRKRHSEFWFALRTRLQTFASRLSIRHGYQVVEVGKK